MTQDEVDDLSGRMAAFQELLAVLFMERFAATDAGTARSEVEQIVNAPKSLAQGAGLMDAERLQSIAQTVASTQLLVLQDALRRADALRAFRRGG